MLRMILALCLLIPGALFAQTLTPNQRVSLYNAIMAETDATAVALRAARNDYALADWCNSESTTDAWLDAADSRTLFEAMNPTLYDTLTAGKRALWDLLLRNAPLDLGRSKLRNAIVDVWGATDSVPVLQALREKATRCQLYLGGTSRTTNTVTGLDRVWGGTISGNEMSTLLNEGR